MADAMMLANRPADTAISSGMVDGSSPSISIGNYKGVMLCNRPFAGVQAVAATGGAAKAAFVCGQVPREVGLTKYKNDAVAVKRTKKETALTRHRKWLSDLQRTKNDLERGYHLECQAKEETKKRFMEREAKMRAMVKSSRQEVLGATSQTAEDKAVAFNDDPAAAPMMEETKAFDSYSDAAGDAKPETTSEMAAEEAAEMAVMASRVAAAKLNGGGGGKKVPMWAMTEDKAAVAAQEREDEELEELLSFAQGLDFEKYIDDMEIATMMDQVKKRISELEATKDDEAFELEYDENGLPIRGEARPQTLTADRIAALQRRFGTEDDSEEKDGDDETRSVARSVLSENRDLGAVHSQRSVAAIAAKKMEAIDEGASPRVGGGSSTEAKMSNPRIVTHTDDEGTRMANKNNIQNLPYMNRNPSV